MNTTFWSNCSGIQGWLTRPECLSVCGRCCTRDQKTPQHLENQFCHEGKSMFWPFILNQTMNTDFLIQLQWYTVLPDYTWTPFHLWKMLYQVPEESSTPVNKVSPWRQFNVLAMLLTHTMNTHFLSPLQWHTILTGSTRIPVHPWSQSGLVWFSINGQNTDSPWWQNRFFRCWGVFCFLAAHDSWVKRCPGGVSWQCVPSQLDQKVCIHGLVQYKWTEHWLTFMAQPVFQMLSCLLVFSRASVMGKRCPSEISHNFVPL